MARLFIILSIFMLALISPVFANNSTVTAGLNVICPGIVIINANASYMKYTNMSISYKLYTTSQCSMPSINGTIRIISKSNSTAVFSRKITAYNITNATPHVASKISIPTSGIASSNYYAALAFYEPGYSITNNSNLFEISNPANIVITNLAAAPSSVPIGSQVVLSMNLSNLGQLTSSAIKVSIAVKGPQNSSIQYIANPLSTYQSEKITMTISNYAAAGTYYVYATASYNTTMYNTTLQGVSNTASTSFSVYSTSPPTPTPSPSPTPTPLPKQVTKPITTTPSIGITTAPLIISGLQGTIQLSQLGLENTANTTEIVNISVPKQYSGMLHISANSIALKAGASISVQLAFSSNSTTSTGTYTIPINLSASINNKTTSTTEYMMFPVYSKSNSRITNQILLANNTNTASGIVKIANPGNTTMSNVHVITMLPELIAKNASYISAYGLSNNITVANGYYVINWYIPYIPAGQSTYAYYTVSKPQNQALLANIQNIMEVPSAIKPSSVLKVIDINTPTFYSNSTNVISVEELYTGTSSQQVIVQLLAPPGVSINPNFITVNATPNQAMIQKFYVSIGSFTGTEMLNLYISTPGFNITYTLPAIVLPLPTTTLTTTIAAVQRQAIPATYYVATATILIIIILLLFGMKYAKKPRYNVDKASELKQIRETIKREE
jgi:hypothetical protein